MPHLTNLDVQFVSLVDRAAVRQAEDPTQPQRFLIWKREDAQGEPMTATAEETQAALEKAQADRDAALEDVKKAQTERDELAKRVETLEKAAKTPAPGDAEPDEDDINKADLPPAVRARLEKAEADAAETRGRLEKAEEIAKEERDARLTREFVAKAEAMPALPGTATEIGPVLKTVADSVPADTFAALETLLKASNDQIRQSELFKEQGSGGDGQRTGVTEEVMRKTEELRKSDSTLSQAAAMDRVLSEDRELSQRYLAEVR